MTNQNNQTKKTINEKELEILKFWNENKIFEKSNSKINDEEKEKESFTFYDGPPFATGLPHHGHILAGTIKDIIPRYQTMNGKYVRRIWGWDCHGLPIENLIEKEFNLNSKKEIENFGIDKFNKAAENSVLKYEKDWKEFIPRMGRWIDMENSYKTMDYTYTESCWWAFSELNKKGLVYEGYKVMHICPRCETTLAQSEVNMPEAYKDLTDISLTAKFKLLDEENTFVLAWTTTPWTLPGNVALAIHKEIDYVKAEVKNKDEIFEKYILAKDRIKEVLEKINLEYKILEEFKGEKILDFKYEPVFPYFKDANLENKENIYKIVHGDFVETGTGTGVVHIAPAFGEDDYNLSKKENLPILKHVKINGEFIPEVLDFQNLKIKTNLDNQAMDILIIKYLAEKKLLFSKEKIIHSYPTCWRCNTPLLNYATSSWFINVSKIKEKNIFENQKINWTPENVKDGRFGKWIENARDWAVSRARYWGAPLPVWKEVEGEEVKFIGSLKELGENNLEKPKNEYYLMRHAEAMSNVKKIVETHKDPDNHLTEKGKEQIIFAKENFEKENFKVDDFDIIISSPFPRTKETAEIFVGEKNKNKIILDENFQEIDLGSYTGLPPEEMFKKYGKIDYLKLNTRIGDGETHQECMDRCMKALSDLEKKYKNKKILIVTHGAPFRMILVGANLLTEEELLNDEKSNNSILYPHNAEIKKIENFYIVPRDENGKINLHRPYIDEVKFLSKNGKEMKRVEYVFDCWYESGSMPFAQFHYPFENKQIFEKENFPADFIAEGQDQTRGWFYSLLNMSVGLFDKASYKNVICTGLINSEDGLKMSKSKKNYTDPKILVEKFGADSFRYYLMSSPAVVGESVNFSDKGVEEVYKKVVSKLENVLSFFEMIDFSNYNLDNYFKYMESNFSNFLEEFNETENSFLNYWITLRLESVINNTTENLKKYKINMACFDFTDFIDDFSNWWLRRSREKLKENDKDTINTFIFILYNFSICIAPFMPFLSERIYKVLQKNNKTEANKKESVHLEKWSTIEVLENGIEIKNKIFLVMKKIRNICSQGLLLRQQNNLNVRQPLQYVSILIADKENINFNEIQKEIIKDELNVKEIKFHTKEENKKEIFFDLNITPELEKEGKFREFVREIKDFRKENNFIATDIISIKIYGDKARMGLIKSLEVELIKECKLKEIILEEGEEKIELV